MNTYEEFLEHVASQTGGSGDEIARIYHQVRRIPYGAAGQRDPRGVYERNVGSCSGKHILLRDLLRRAGHEAEIVTMFTHFNKGVPDHPALPEEVRRLAREDEIPDFHHYVRVRDRQGQWLKLDATWHDALIAYGFPVNQNWRGNGDTVLAAEPLHEYPAAEDLAVFKKQLVDQLPEEDAAKRRHFFKLLGDWIATL